MFRDRKDAGRQLAEKLTRYRAADAIVLALPRGGVVVGHEIAHALALPLDVVVTRKIGHPDNPEYAICAVDGKGTLLCDETGRKGIDQSWFKEELERQRKEARRRESLYREGKGPRSLEGKIVILTDDGIATGLTMRLAIRAVKLERPKFVVVAVPVAPQEVAEEIKREVDELLVLPPLEDFGGAVGIHYLDFEQIEDTEVIQLLRQAR